MDRTCRSWVTVFVNLILNHPNDGMNSKKNEKKKTDLRTRYIFPVYPIRRSQRMMSQRQILYARLIPAASVRRCLYNGVNESALYTTPLMDFTGSFPALSVDFFATARLVVYSSIRARSPGLQVWMKIIHKVNTRKLMDLNVWGGNTTVAWYALGRSSSMRLITRHISIRFWYCQEFIFWVKHFLYQTYNSYHLFPPSPIATEATPRPPSARPLCSRSLWLHFEIRSDVRSTSASFSWDKRWSWRVMKRFRSASEVILS